VKKKTSGKSVRTQKKRIAVRGRGHSTLGVNVPVNAVFLVGFMGAGKSSVGRALGQRLNWLFEDLDDRIEQREQRTVPEIFRDSGEVVYRQVEHEILRQILRESVDGASKVVALGGGTFAQPQNHSMLQENSATTVFLDAPLPELWKRCAEQGGDVKRPLQRSQNIFRELFAQRLPFYITASLKIDTGGKHVEAVANEIAEKLGLKRIPLRTEQGEVE
jgi:shikimate kinase